MRAVPDDLDPRVVARIDARLDGVGHDHGATVAWAVESGSRAWGFPSPDSDYDCRFLYVHPADAYLTPWPPRDVVETPLDHVYDVNGWDLRKALDLLVRGNATVGEWLRSPIVYRGEPAFRDLLLDLADRVAEPALTARHYLHLGQQQWERLGAGDPDRPVRLKGVFYALRPAAVPDWLDRHDGVPPMRLQEVLAACDPPAALTEAVEHLVALKARTRELGTGPVPAPVRAFVLAHLGREDLAGTGARRTDVAVARSLASEVFREAVRRFG